MTVLWAYDNVYAEDMVFQIDYLCVLFVADGSIDASVVGM
jgi:hypothetical protein